MSNGNAPAPASAAHPRDLILETLNKAVEGVTSAKPDHVASSIAANLNSFFTSKLPPAPGDSSAQDVCSNPDSVHAPFCAQLTFDTDKAESTYSASQGADESTLRTALGQWKLAISQYNLSIAQADQSFQSAVKTAVEAYNQKQNSDSQSRSQNLYFQMQETAAAALITFEGQISSAAQALAGAAGTLISAYLVYVASVGSAAAQQASDKATAQATFWGSLEGALDAL